MLCHNLRCLPIDENQLLFENIGRVSITIECVDLQVKNFVLL